MPCSWPKIEKHSYSKYLHHVNFTFLIISNITSSIFKDLSEIISDGEWIARGGGGGAPPGLTII